MRSAMISGVASVLLVAAHTSHGQTTAPNNAQTPTLMLSPNCQQYSTFLDECGDFSRAVGRQLRAVTTATAVFNVTELQPGVVCDSPCFEHSSLNTMKYALAGGCVGELASIFPNLSAAEYVLKIEQFVDAVEGFMCAKNGDTFCAEYLYHAETIDTAPEASCTNLRDAGCCLQNYIHTNLQIVQVFPTAPSAIDVYTAVAKCDGLSIPEDVCPGTYDPGLGADALSQACASNPIDDACTSFAESFVIELYRHALSNSTSHLSDPITLCSDACFSPANLRYIYEYFSNGCEVPGALQYSGGQIGNQSLGQAMLKSESFLNVIGTFDCARNPEADNQYCGILLENGIELSDAAISACEVDATSQNCSSAKTAACQLTQNAGCCMRNLVAVQPAIQVLHPDSPTAQNIVTTTQEYCNGQLIQNTMCPGSTEYNVGSELDGLEPTDIPFTPSGNCNAELISTCASVGRMIYEQVSNVTQANGGNFNLSQAPILDPTSLCSDSCFDRTRWPAVKQALQQGCFGPLEMTAGGGIEGAVKIALTVDNAFDFIEDFYCAKNGPTFCGDFLERMISSSGDHCALIADAGCCVQNFLHCDAHARALLPAAPTGLQILAAAATCNVSVSSDTCPNYANANVGGGGLSESCAGNSVLNGCEDFAQSFIQQVARSHMYGTSIEDFSPNYTCENPCFTRANLVNVQKAVRDGCFEQMGLELWGGLSAEEQEKSVAAIDAYDGYVCAKNQNGSYCGSFTTPEKLAEDSCANFEAAGCCLANLVAQDAAISVFNSSMPTGPALAQDLALKCNIVIPTEVCPDTIPINLGGLNPDGSPSQSNDGSDGDHLSTGDDIGIAIGVLLFIVAVGVGISYYLGAQKKSKNYSAMHTNEAYASAYPDQVA